MPIETFSEAYGQRGSVLTRTTGSGVVSKVISTALIQKSVTSTVNRTPRHKPSGWLYPTTYRRTLSVIDRGNGVHVRSRVPPTTSGGYYQTYEETGVIDEIAGNLQTSLSLLPVHKPDQENRALIEALLSLKEQRVNLAQAYAERQMTANLLASSLNRIARSVSLLRRRKFKKAWQEIGGHPKKLPGSWLEYQYGWNPLLQDIKGSVDALQRRQSLDDWIITVKGNVTEKGRLEDYPNPVLEWPCVRKTSWMRGYFVRLDYNPGNTFLSTLSSLGLTNPALLAWELLPYSFVLDWLLPVGDWLSCLDAANGFEFHSGSTTRRRECTTFVKALTGKVTSANPYVVSRADYECSRREFDLERVIHLSSPFPNFPGFKDPFSLTHVANGFSLLSQALAGKPPKVY
jgi:hypothetical protein